MDLVVVKVIDDFDRNSFNGSKVGVIWLEGLKRKMRNWRQKLWITLLSRFVVQREESDMTVARLMRQDCRRICWKSHARSVSISCAESQRPQMTLPRVDIDFWNACHEYVSSKKRKINQASSLHIQIFPLFTSYFMSNIFSRVFFESF